MAEIHSKLGVSHIESPKGNQKVFKVEDHSQQRDRKPAFTAGSFNHNSEMQAQSYRRAAESRALSPEELREYEAQRKEIIEEQNKISPEARQRIEFLLGLGHLSDTVEVENVKFTFRSLEGDEQKEVFKSLSNFKEMSALHMQYEIRFETLGRALTHIEARRIEDVIESNDPLDRINLIRRMNEELTDFLYKWYKENIVDVVKNKLEIKDKEDLKEVVETIKKS